MTLNLAVLASGKGSNCLAVLKAIEAGKLDARVVLVLTNNPQAGVLDIAAAHSVPVFAKSHRGISRSAFDQELLDAVRASGADAVVLAGYMRILTPAFVQAFKGRIINVHPALLPSFSGASGAHDALAYGVRLTGCTVHFVDELADHGPVIIQAAVPVTPEETEETLMPRVHAMEHIILPQALQWLAEDRLRLNGRKVTLLGKDRRSAMPVHGTVGKNAFGPYLISPAPEIPW